MKVFYPMLLASAVSFGAIGIAAPAQDKTPRATDTSSDRPKGLDQIIDSTYKLKNVVDLHADIYPVNSTTLIGEGTGHSIHYASCFGIANTASGTYLLTSAHVTKDGEEHVQPHPLGVARVRAVAQHLSIIRVRNGVETEVCTLEEIARDGDNDISLLFAKDTALETYGKFIKPDQVKLGDTAYTIGFPHRDAGSFGKTLHRGIVSCIDSDLNYDKWKFIDSTLDPGMSGGPTLVQANGRVYILGVNSIQFDINVLRNTFGAARNIIPFLLKQDNGTDLLGWKMY